jgi:hypothetical protein
MHLFQLGKQLLCRQHTQSICVETQVRGCQCS